MAPKEHPLATVLEDAARGTFPAADGSVDVLPADAAIIFAPAGELVPAALRSTAKGGIVVCAGIHMSDIPSFAYADLWGERTLRSVANLTRVDGDELLALAPTVPVQTHIRCYPLEELSQAVDDLRGGRVQGAAVIDVGALRGTWPPQ